MLGIVIHLFSKYEMVCNWLILLLEMLTQPLYTVTWRIDENLLLGLGLDISIKLKHSKYKQTDEMQPSDIK